jgi:hypothetical protein
MEHAVFVFMDVMANILGKQKGITRSMYLRLPLLHLLDQE